MVSKNNWQYQQQRQAQRVPHYGLRKLSVGVASVLLSTTLYMGVSAHADTVVTPGEATTTVTTPSPSADKATSETTGSGANATSTDPASETLTSQATPDSAGATSEKPVDSTAGAKGVSETADSKVGSGTPVNDGQPADPQSTVNRLANTTGTTTTTVASDATRKTTLNTTITWTIHYVDETGNHLQPDSVVSHDYTRTDIGDQMGNWSYVPNSVKVTGTPNAGSHIDNPDFKFDQIEGKATFDYASWYAAAASIDGYTPDYSSVVITDQLPKNPEGLHATTIVDSGKHECTFVYTQRPKTVTINYVNDDDNENVVKTDSVNGKPNTEVTITPNLPSGYMLAPGKDVPSKYTMTDGDNQVVTIHVQKQLVDVSDTDPQAKQTRTITLHYVYDGGSKDGQKAFDDAVLDVYYHRTATFDRSTNQTTYGDWTWDNSQGDTSTPGYHVVSGKWTNLPQSWANVTADVPNIKGYHADLGQNDPTNTNHVPANTWVFPTYNNRAGAGVSDSNKGATAYLDGYGYEVSPTHTIKYVPNQTTVTVNYVDDDNNKTNVGSQHWDGTIGQHIDLTLTPPTNYVLSPGWVNPSSYDFDGVNSMWYTVHVKHATQDVTDQQPKDQVNKTETLTRKHLYGPGPHEGENFGDPDIIEVPWHRTAMKDLVTDKVSFGDWHVVWNEVKQLSGATKMWGDSEHNWVNGGLIPGHSGYSYLGAGAKAEAIATDGTVSRHDYYWNSESDIEKNPTIVQYYGRYNVSISVNYVDFDTNQQLGTKGLTGDDYLDGNTITFNKGDLTDWGTSINKKYQLYAGQTLPTTYKIDTVSNNGNLTPITVYVVQPRTVQFTFADKDSTVNGQHPQVGDAVSVTGVTGSTTPVNLTMPAGYKLVEGQQLPTTYTFVKGGQNQVILLTHQHVTVQPDAPKTTTDALPDNPGKNYPSGVAKDDLSKTVTRKVTITSPDGKSTVTNQTVTFTRNATVDEVTGNVTYGSWSENGKHTFATVDVPNVPGYAATGDVPSLTVTPDSKDTTVTIGYTANKQQVNINYVDISDGNKVVHTTTINGVTDGDSVVPNELPAGYKLVDGQSIPKTIHFNADNNDDINIKVQHTTVTVTPDSPKTPSDKLPDNPDKSYPSGVSENDLNKTITRTIKVTTPDGQTKTVAQTVKLTRTSTVDEVTGEVTYGKWSTGQWNAYDVPTVPGYTASQTSVATTPVDENTKDQTVDVSYTPNKQSTVVKYVDDKGQVVHTTTVNGATDQTVKVSSEVPAGWTITNGQVPSEITFGADGHEPIEVTVDHRHITVTPDQPQNNGTKLPDNPAKTFSGVEANDLNKTITRTIKVTTPDGQTKTVVQTVKLTRTADVDEVTGEVTYGKWTTGQWDAYEIPALKGYTPSQASVEATSVDENTKDQTVDISYTANSQTTHINYVDDAGETVHTTIITGETGETVKVPNEVPAGWKITKGEVPSEISFGPNGYADETITIGHQHVTVDPDHPQNNGTKLPDNPAKTFNGVETNDLNKTITRTIEVTTPDGKSTTTKQTVKLTRTADVDEVTGEVTYGKWTTGQWNAYEVPALNGYTASQTSVETTPVDESTKDQTVEVSYTPNKQSTTIKYVDDKGQTIHTTTVNGLTDQKVKVPNEVPAGWMITKGEVPSELTFSADGHGPIEVTVDHQHVTVDPDHPQNNGTKLPDNPAKTFEGVEANDLNKIITRTIKVTTPDGKLTVTKQTAKLTRTADVDEVTGEVTYGNWTTGQWNAYEVSALKGYTASQTSVETTPVDENTKDQTVEVSYTPNKQSTTIKYVDDKDQTIHTTTVNGVTDQTVKVPSEVPAGWTITKGKVPSEITFGADGHESVVITVGHQHVTVTPDQPRENGTKLPDNSAKTFSGVEANDLNKPITRTIKVTTPDGKVTATKQTVKLTRTADVDEVTGEVTYGNWTTGQWGAYEVPALKGYTASQTSVETTPVDENTKDQMVEVSYTPNKQSTTIKYVDGKGQVVHTTTVDGVTAQNVKVPNKVPAGWIITKGEVPSEIAFGVDGHEPIEVTVDHRHVTVTPDQPQNNGTKLPDNPTKTFSGVETSDLNKTITRTIKVTTPDGQTKTVAQTAKLTRNADVDEVTGEVTYGKWTTGEWAAYDAPSVAGYTPSQTAVAKESVTATSKDTTVEITYRPMQHQISVEYVDDDDHGKIVKTDQVPGKTDQTITVTPSAPANYDLVDNGNRTYTVTSNDAQVVQIHVKHHQVTTSESKTVTRTINVHTPHDGTKVVKQNAELTRKVTTDQVTGEKTYGDWTTGQWESYTPEAIPGYTPSTNEVPNTNVNGNSKNQMVDVTYTADAQKVEIVYVDDTKGDAVVKTDQIAGKTDETVKVTPDVPAGYELVGKVPGDYTMTAGGHQTITVHLVHQMKTVSESKTVTRTINVHTPHDGAKTIKQTAELTRDVTTDQVTGEKTYGDWSTAEWDRYAVPAIAGYVPSVEQVAQQVVNGITTDQIIDVTYSSGEHTTHINYVDSDGNIVHTTTIKGQTDGTAQVPNETPAGWTVVGEPVPTELAFGPDGHSDVTVTVDHQHVTVTPDQPKIPTDKLPDNPAKMYPNGVGNDNLNKTITRTIKIVMPDGQTKTVAQTAHLTRTADVDEVTGEVTYGKWTTGEWSNYDVPTVPGYTPSQSEVPAQTVSFGDNDVVKTVTYKANTQKLKVVFIDDTTGKTLNTIEKAGLSDTDSGYNTKADISDYAAKHYDLVSDGTNGQNLVFDHDDGKGQHYEVHLVHATHPIDEQVSTKQTIHYQLVDGTKVFDDHTAQVDFSRDGYNDEVTNENHWNKWTPSDIQTFSKVVSPVKSGYTPDKASVAAVDVHPSDKNVEETVIYSPDKQVMTINYIDDVTGKTLSTKQITGFSDASANYNTKSSINSYVAGHYKLVSDDTNSDNLVFDHDDSIDQVYNVHLTHSYQKVDDHKSVNETVHYIYDDGQTARPDYKAPAINFSRTGTKDLVTSNIVWNAWTPAEQSFDQVTTPAISGYTPDVEVVPGVNVSHGSDDLERTVIYHADDQTILVNYIDDDTHSTLKTDTVIGKTAQKSNYTTKKSIDGYIADHYKLVSDDTNDNELVFDSDSTKAQVYNVHLKHAHQNVSDSALVNETIHYVYADGSKARNDYHAPVISFKRTGDKDLVTNAIVWNDWIPASQDFKTVDSPVIDGYTPSQKTISNITVKPGDKDIDQTVVYAPDTQSIVVNYIDDVTGKTLKTDTLTGKSDRASDYTTKNNINGYENQHYVLVSDDTQGKTLTFDHDDKATQVYNVHLSHQTELASQSRTVHETINYVYADGSKASDTVTANPLTFTQTGVKDLVTNAIAWNDDWTSKQTFAEVKSPEITGYTASRTSVDPITVDHNSSDIHQTVIYTANDQTARINYIDDVTGKTLETDSANGKFGDQINFGHDVDTQIKVFEGQGYKFKSNSFNGQKYQADNSQNEFEIHFTHGTQNVSRTNKVTETVKYQFADGRQAQKDHAQTVEFTQHGVQDLVTKTTVWTPSDPQTFASVDTPHITGYTSDIQNVPAATVNFGDEDIVKTVTYKANQQKLDVVFIDDVTGQVLKTANKIGLSDADSGYNTKADISDYAAKHYDLVSDGTNGKNLMFDHDDDTDQHYEVHLTHHKSDTSRQSTVNETIHYVYENSKQAADDYAAKPIVFTQTGVKDDVTGDIVWNKVDGQQFAKVTSPVISGYTADVLEVPAQTVSFGDNDIVKTVTYKANTQKLKVVFIDDTTGKTLNTIEKTGLSDTDSGYNTKADISDYAAKHYDLVSDGTNGQNLVFDHDDDTDQHYEVHLTHHKSDTSRQSTVNETIHYVYENSKQAADDYAAKPIVYTQTGVKDLVTGDTDWNGQWTSDQEFKAVDSPEITGYTPSRKTVDAIKVSHDTSDIKRVVTYVANNQVAKITYIDDVTGKVLATDEVSGKFGSRVDYNALARINSFEKQGYQLKTNGFDQPSYQADDTKNQFEIRLIHQLNKTSRESTVTRTISYVDSITGLTLHQPIIQTLKFIEGGVTDLVTNETTWQAASRQQFVSVKVPEIKGYASELSVVEPTEVGFGDANIETTVKYKKLDVTNTISYVDSQGKVIKTDTVSGQSGTEIKLDVPSGYHLVDNQTKVTISENNSTQTVKIAKDNSANKIARHLPQTGNQRETGLVALGFAAGLLGLVVLRKKRN